MSEDNPKLTIKPVYSELASPEESNKYTGKLQLARHQLETLAAYNDPDVDIIFNTAMTGDGKTLAAYLPALLNGRRVMAAYPTNELIRDQKRSLDAKLSLFSYRSDAIKEMNGGEITRLMEEENETVRADQVRRILGGSEILLTNPDLFHLLGSSNYGWNQRREFIARMQSNFDYFILDEFHVFGPPQVIAVMNIINTIMVERRVSSADHKRKFIFLSATPDQLMQNMLSRTGINYRLIKGKYSDVPQPNSRRILAGCDLYLTPTSRENNLEQWVRQHTTELLDFYKNYPGSKGAIIVNSVATARRLVNYLKPLFERQGLSVSENTGLTGKQTRSKSFGAALLVGTSTVDVGVDFQINLLIFEANSAADFLQRFGRLGRHESYEQDGQTVHFAPDSYRAYAMCPGFICEGFRREIEKAGLTTDEPLSRPWFSQEVVPAAFPDRQAFRLYAKRWGLAQAASIIVSLENPKFDKLDNYGEQRQATVEQMARSFDAQVNQLWGAVSWYRKQQADPKGQVLLDEVNSFRGTSLSCGVWDVTDKALKTYNLLFILANSRFEILTEEQFMTEVDRRGENRYDYRFQLLYLKVLEYLLEADNFSFSLGSCNLRQQAALLNHAEVLSGFKIANLARANVNEVNRVLKTQKLVCTITAEWSKPADLRTRLNLPGNFPVHALTDNASTGYCVTFGKQALLLDSLLYWRKNQSDPQAYFDFE